MNFATKGFTLVELMIALAIIVILAGFALPAYNNYVRTSEQGVLLGNMETISVFQEDVFLRTGSYAVGLANIAEISAAIQWEPRTTDGILYEIDDNTVNPDEMYRIRGTHPSGFTLCKEYPAKTIVACP